MKWSCSRWNWKKAWDIILKSLYSQIITNYGSWVSMKKYGFHGIGIAFTSSSLHPEEISLQVVINSQESWFALGRKL